MGDSARLQNQTVTKMKPIQFSKHSLEQMAERGADEDEVSETIRTGEAVPAKKGRQGFRKNLQYNRL